MSCLLLYPIVASAYHYDGSSLKRTSPAANAAVQTPVFFSSWLPVADPWGHSQGAITPVLSSPSEAQPLATCDALVIL